MAKDSDTLVHDPNGGLPRLLEIMRRLRDPETGCPWDIEQDFATIAPYTIEEAYEVADAIEREAWGELKGELGDLLFVCANLGRHAGVDPEDALRRANAKFERRFRFIEQALRDSGRPIEACNLDELDALWGEAKRQEKNLPSCG